jgi:trk system potassium uptake protein TrkA
MKLLIFGNDKISLNVASFLSSYYKVTLINEAEESGDEESDGIDFEILNCKEFSVDILSQFVNYDEEFIFLALSSSDEKNIAITCLVDSLFEKPKKIAKISHKSYLYFKKNQPIKYKHIDEIFVPEERIAERIVFNISEQRNVDLSYSFFNKNIIFSVLTVINDTADQLTIAKINSQILSNIQSIRIFGVIRNDEYLEINKNFKILKYDKLLLIGDDKQVSHIDKLINDAQESYKKNEVVICGGGKIGSYIAEKLNKYSNKFTISIVDNKIKSLSQSLIQNKNNKLIRGGATNPATLMEAGCDNAQFVISVTNKDTTNIISAMTAKNINQKNKTIAIIEHKMQGDIAQKTGIDEIIDPTAITKSTIFSILRKNIAENSILIADNKYELIEINFFNKKIEGVDKINKLEKDYNINVISSYDEGFIDYNPLKSNSINNKTILIFGSIESINKISRDVMLK